LFWLVDRATGTCGDARRGSYLPRLPRAWPLRYHPSRICTCAGTSARVLETTLSYRRRDVRLRAAARAAKYHTCNILPVPALGFCALQLRSYVPA